MCTVLEYLSLLLKNSCFLFITCLYITDRASIGDLVYLNLINDIYYTSISEVINIQINLRDLHGAACFVSEEIEANYEEDGHVILDRIETISGEIKNIGYGNTELITEGSFAFHKGDRIALTGESGSGKSTFAKMLTKFLRCEGIKVNGYDIRCLENRALRERIFYLAQSSWLLPFSIKENITLGNAVPEEKWRQLLQMEFMQKFVRSEAGLDGRQSCLFYQAVRIVKEMRCFRGSEGTWRILQKWILQSGHERTGRFLASKGGGEE